MKIFTDPIESGITNEATPYCDPCSISLSGEPISCSGDCLGGCHQICDGCVNNCLDTCSYECITFCGAFLAFS
jgi:hypothetical protein